jgi:hypothetical protein
MLNILVFRALHSGKVKALPAHLQTVVPVIATSNLERSFSMDQYNFNAFVSIPNVLHWASPKPCCSVRHPFLGSIGFFSRSWHAINRLSAVDSSTSGHGDLNFPAGALLVSKQD